MRAAVLRAAGDLAWTEVADPEPFGERPVLLRIGAVGVCGSDVLRFSSTGVGAAYHYPLVMGHEFSAIVEEPAPGGVLTRGQQVAVFPLLPREDDPLTGVGEWALGADYDYFGSRRDGGMAELLYAPERNLIPVPSGVSLVQAAVVEPAAVALHGVGKLTVPAHGTALVIGAGPIGALAAQWLRLLGWARVLVADVDARKRDVMAGLGFEVIDAARGTVEQARDLTGGRGVDAAVEASGLPLTFGQCLEVTAARGQVLVLGDLKGDVTIARELISSFIRRELVVRGTWNSRITPAGHSEWHRVVGAIADGSLQVDPLISHRVELARSPETFAALAERSEWSNKVVFTVAEEAATVRGDES